MQNPADDLAGVSNNASVFGADLREGVTGCEVRQTENGTCEAILWRRSDGGVHQEIEQFHPWTVAMSRIENASCRTVRLEGDMPLTWLLEFDSFHAYQEARETLVQQGFKHTENMLAYPSLIRQYLMRSGVTFFKGMAFEDVLRMQIDIETTSISAGNRNARVLMVAVTDTGGFEEAVVGTEKEIMERLNEIIAQRDPDVIEGHNLFGFDLPYLHGRSAAVGVPLTWGRDGSVLRFATYRRSMGFLRSYFPATVSGRSLIDTLIGVQRYDMGRSELSSYGLKEVAQQLGIAAPDRVYLDRRAMEQLWESDPENVARYALQDVAETASLSALVTPPEFYISQMVPDSFQANASGGTGEKINLLMVREYLRQGHSLPLPKPGRQVAGGYTELRRSGYIQRIVKGDVESLYPSLMLARGIAPGSDTLGVFLPLLKDLTTRRLEAKSRKSASEGPEWYYWDGLQSSFKILINSFYGYLGAGFLFNDPDAAEAVTSGGKEIVLEVVDEIEKEGCAAIEVDTDGVYFQPPEHIQTMEQESELIDRISERLPEGINLAHDGRWRAMLSLKVKNYVLIGYNGQVIYRGAALRSRADERFGQEFIGQVVELISGDRWEEIADVYRDFQNRIRQGQMKPRDICRRERVTAKSLQGKSLQRAAKALEGAEQGDYLLLYRREDGMLARLEEYAGDEDRDFLLEKLHKFAQRLAPVLGDDLDRLCPHPFKRTPRNTAQQTLDLFE